MSHYPDLNEPCSTICFSATLCVLVLPAVATQAVKAATQKNKVMEPFMLQQP